MKKLLPWEEALVVAVIAFFIKYLLGGALGNVFAIVGIIYLFVAYFRHRKSKRKNKDDDNDNSNVSNKKLKEVFKKNKSLSFTIGFVFIVLVVFFTYFYDIGLNSKYFVKKDFSQAFLLRQTGNCEEFVKYINKDWANWVSRCYEEKGNNDAAPINTFTIKEVTVNGNRSFLQVEIKRNDVDFKEYSYMVNYEMVRSKGGWLIDQSMP